MRVPRATVTLFLASALGASALWLLITALLTGPAAAGTAYTTAVTRPEPVPAPPARSLTWQLAAFRETARLDAIRLTPVPAPPKKKKAPARRAPATQAAQQQAPPQQPQAPPPPATASFYTAPMIAALWEQAGGNPAYASVAVCIAEHESGGNPGATNYDSNGTVDRGLFQINSSNGYLSTYSPLANARAAVLMSADGTNWFAWTTSGYC